MHSIEILVNDEFEKIIFNILDRVSYNFKKTYEHFYEHCNSNNAILSTAFLASYY